MVEMKKCAWCGTPFRPKANSQKYCNPQCAKQAYLDANAQLHPVPANVSCPHNANLVCERRACGKCGWNPKVSKRRLENILAALEGKK